LLKEDLQRLILLQKIDRELARIHGRKKELPGRLSRLDEDFSAARGGVEAEGQRLEDVLKNHRAKEENLKRGIENLKKTKERLFEVKTNKEYQAMLKEIEMITTRNSGVEDEIILMLEEVDAARNSLKAKEHELVAFREAYEKEKKEIEGELALIDSQLAQRIAKVKNLRGKMNPETLSRYERIKSRGNGLAVVSVWKGVCEGCHMNIPPQMYNELQRSEDIMECPFCNRIIFWNDREKNG
jgi:predicted  nucleic acid-binding Zn-ribbon protein